MTMLAIHCDAIDNKAACYHEFLLRYSRNARTVYGFVEGKDDPCFYRGFINQMLPDDWNVEMWPAGNKRQVYQVYADVDWRRFPKRRVCFFADRDLSDMIPETFAQDRNIYLTDGYSIENDVVKKETCRRLLTEIWGFGNTPHAEIDEICDLFEQELEAFLLGMIHIMAWILYWKRNGERPNLNNLQMGHLFSFEAGRLRVIGTPQDMPSVAAYIHKQCNVVTKHDVDITVVEAEFQQDGVYRKFTRGKYLLWFLVAFCNAVHRSTTSLFRSVRRPPRVRGDVSSSHGMVVIGDRARMPSSLRVFLSGTYCKYIQSKSSRK